MKIEDAIEWAHRAEPAEVFIGGHPRRTQNALWALVAEVERLTTILDSHKDCDVLAWNNTGLELTISQLTVENAQLRADACDHCVMTGRGPSRLKFDNPPIGHTWCELLDGSGCGTSESLLWREGYDAELERACSIMLEMPGRIEAISGQMFMYIQRGEAIDSIRAEATLPQTDTDCFKTTLTEGLKGALPATVAKSATVDNLTWSVCRLYDAELITSSRACELLGGVKMQDFRAIYTKFPATDHDGWAHHG